MRVYDQLLLSDTLLDHDRTLQIKTRKTNQKKINLYKFAAVTVRSGTTSTLMASISPRLEWNFDNDIDFDEMLDNILIFSEGRDNLPQMLCDRLLMAASFTMCFCFNPRKSDLF